MQLKKVITVLMVAASLKAAAQSANVQSAYNSLNNKEYADAKKFIDEAAQNESTKNNPKMWFYRGKIYLTYARNKDLKAQVPDAGEMALQSYLNCLKTDEKGWHKEDILDGTSNQSIWVAAVEVYNAAGNAVRDKDYAKATRLYNLVNEVFAYDKKDEMSRSNITPNLVTYNLSVVAMNSGDNQKAKENLEKLIAADYKDPKVYVSLSRIYSAEKDTAKAMEVLDKGDVKFPDNNGITNEQLFLSQNNPQKFVDKLSKALENKPDDEKLLTLRGRTYEKQGKIDLAKADYGKVLETNPENLEGNYYMGILVYNEGATMITQARDLKSDAEYNKMKAKGDARIKEAVPFLEKARTNAGDKKDILKDILGALKTAYLTLKDNAKFEEVNNQYKSL